MKEAVKRGEKKTSCKRIEHKRNWDLEIPQLNCLAVVNIYVVRRGRQEGRKTERLPLEGREAGGD